MRCLNLATALRQRGAQCRFICRNHDGNFTTRIQREGFEVAVLTGTGSSRLSSQPDPSNPVAWLSVEGRADAQETIAALGSERPDWLVVDHYSLEARWHQSLRSHCGKIMVIDDLADRNHDCDLLLDQNLAVGMENRYEGLLPASCPRLLGPSFALLQTCYAELHAQAPPRIGPVRRLLVSFGGRDPHGLTEAALDALQELGRKDLVVDLVGDEQSPQWPRLMGKVHGLPHLNLHPSLDSLAGFILRADLALGAGGVTSWERCCLGLPALVVTTAENQKTIAEELDRRKLIRYLGHHSSLSARALPTALRDVLDENLEDWSRRCLATVDGQGAERVADLLMSDLTWNLKARPALRNDEETLCIKPSSGLALKETAESAQSNFPMNRKNFYDCLRNPKHEKIFIAEACNGISWAKVRASCREGHWHLGLDLEPNLPVPDPEQIILQATVFYMRRSLSGPLILREVSVKSSRNSASKDHNDCQLLPNGQKKNLTLAVCSDSKSWLSHFIADLVSTWCLQGHQCSWVHQAEDTPGGSICFYLGYGRIVGKGLLAKYRNNLVVHESDLPSGKGWSPLTWQILEGKSRIPAVLSEATEKVDSGQIYKKVWMEFNGVELVDELREKQAEATLRLCREFVDNYPGSAQSGVPQHGAETFYPRRTAEDSRLDPQKSLAEQFNLLRVTDPSRYPAFFKYGGENFKIHVYKKD